MSSYEIYKKFQKKSNSNLLLSQSKTNIDLSIDQKNNFNRSQVGSANQASIKLDKSINLKNKISNHTRNNSKDEKLLNKSSKIKNLFEDYLNGEGGKNKLNLEKNKKNTNSFSRKNLSVSINNNQLIKENNKKDLIKMKNSDSIVHLIKSNTSSNPVQHKKNYHSSHNNSINLSQDIKVIDNEKTSLFKLKTNNESSKSKSIFNK